MRPRGWIRTSCAVWLALAAAAQQVNAESSLEVRLQLPSDRADAAAAELRTSGFDVVPRQAGEDVVVVVSEAEAGALRRLGYGLEVVGRGMPALESLRLVEYPTLAEILARLRRAASMAPRIARVVDLTEELGVPPTFENRPVHALRITDNAASSEDEPAILVMAGLHPRELVNPLIALDLVDRLVAGYGRDPVITEIVDANDIWIVPIANPDGYEYVFAVDNLWRKNRQPFADGVGVDLNRNFPFGWDSACAGADSAASRFYKGPSPASEHETRAVLALTDEVWFAKVLEFHSPGREVLWGSPCSELPFDAFVGEKAVELSQALGYQGRTRAPSADGEHHQWQLARTGTLSFLVETQVDWQPPYPDALAEVERVWPGVLWFLQHPISVSGRVTDACTGAPLAASIRLWRVGDESAEWLQNGGVLGRFHATLPSGEYELLVTAPGYWSQVRELEIAPDRAQVLDAELFPASPAPCHGPPVLAPAADADADAWGCGCRSGDGPSGSALLLLAFAWLCARRRRA